MSPVRPKVALLLQPAWHPQILGPAALTLLRQASDVTDAGPRPLDEAEVARQLVGARACLTGWGTPPFSVALLDRCPELGLIAHTAGSVRLLIPGSAWERGIKVSHAAAVMGRAVAEHVVAQALLCLQRLHVADRRMRQGEWSSIREEPPRRLLGAQNVGIWGAGRVGRLAAQRFRAFDCTVLVCDPHLPVSEAKELGVELVGLEELFGSASVVCLQAPVLEATRGRVGAELLARLPDGAVLVNSGRAALVDETALLRELRSGRIWAALDVFPQEPLPPDNPYRELPNVVLSPHIAGHSRETHLLQGQVMVEEVLRFLRGEMLQHEVTPQMLPIMA
jgi:phosphoglycerate dehydrogenase-like enzyme